MSVAEWVGTVGEFALAGVIFYELEENRAATFLANVQDRKFLSQRAKLYEAYVGVQPSDTSLKSRAEAFKKKLIEDDPKLRAICDQQWSNIDRLQYALLWSPLHRNLLAEWFPQALVSLWVMTGPYVRHLQEIRLHDAHVYAERAVRNSINLLVSRRKRLGRIGPITIYGKANEPSVVISEEMILAMQTRS
jgi:hypothetical protein